MTRKDTEGHVATDAAPEWASWGKGSGQAAPAEQPAPVPNGKRDVQSMVIDDMHARRRLGIERYGTALQAGNGRDMLRDAYEEALDLAVYLRGAIEEREGR